MDNAQIITELELLYSKFLTNGNFEKAQETLLKISDLKTQNEVAKTGDNKNILLG